MEEGALGSCPRPERMNLDWEDLPSMTPAQWGHIPQPLGSKAAPDPLHSLVYPLVGQGSMSRGPSVSHQ